MDIEICVICYACQIFFFRINRKIPVDFESYTNTYYLPSMTILIKGINNIKIFTT
ncbi:hypothetical protein C2G38_2079214 [Gigaspora rosea]|uniref:Uncharacterized protein n=1 Tax=Gigaspora rosea TaxID=44941 RepID=A0A397VGY7_9GLOM|nr:hypothetical protein C2G38_2079214 [Gigaspora rosea]